MRTLEGTLVVPAGSRFAIVASRFNHFIVDRLTDGAVDCIVRHGGASELIDLVRVPGAWEIPLVVQRLARSKKYAGIVAVGAVLVIFLRELPLRKTFGDAPGTGTGAGAQDAERGGAPAPAMSMAAASGHAEGSPVA
jgi:hypothetical protein